MSFGLGIGDIIGVSTLAWKVFKSCKDASRDFKNVVGEVVSLHVVLKETEDLVAESDLSSRQTSQLQQLTDGCQKVLEDLEELLKKYHSLGTKSQRTWDRMKWGSEGVANVRTRLISNTTMLSAYNTTMVSSSIARIERQLSLFMEEVRSGKREGSVISSGTEVLDQEEGDDDWLQLRRELEHIGVSGDAISQHKWFIVSWFQQALAKDREGGGGQLPELAELHEAEEEKMSVYRHPRPSPRDSSVLALRTPEDTTDLEDRQKEIAKVIPIDEERLLFASKTGDLESVSYLLRHGIDVNTDILERGCMTALGMAAMCGHVDITQHLLGRSEIQVNIKNHLGHTPLSLASWYGHPEVVQLLLEHPTTAIDSTDMEHGQTPLSLAAEQGNTSIVKQLLAKGADPNSEDQDGRTPLAWAAEKGRFEATRLLLADSRIMPNRSDRSGVTPLAQAVESGNEIIVRLLLAHPNVEIDGVDRDSRTPIDRVYRQGHYDMLYLFEQAKARRARTTSQSTRG